MSVATPVRRLRARVLTPSVREVDPVHRGFDPWEEGPSIVADVGRSFLRGYAAAMAEPDPGAMTRRVHGDGRAFAGFAMEGAGMGVAVRAATEPWSRGLLHRFLTATGERHVYMTYVGVGWAMARLPRPLWPDLEGLDPLLRPLVLDGYGFHEVFFRTGTVRGGHRVDLPAGAWPGPETERRSALAQGVGRGLWFVVGGSPSRFAAEVARHPEPDHASLWAGVGLACSYAGGRDAETLRRLAGLAGPHAGWLRQGASFAVEARVRAGLVTDHTVLAARTLTGLDPGALTEVVRRCRPQGWLVDVGRADYEQWRTRIAQELDRVPA